MLRRDSSGSSSEKAEGFRRTWNITGDYVTVRVLIDASFDALHQNICLNCTPTTTMTSFIESVCSILSKNTIRIVQPSHAQLVIVDDKKEIQLSTADIPYSCFSSYFHNQSTQVVLKPLAASQTALTVSTPTSPVLSAPLQNPSPMLQHRKSILFRKNRTNEGDANSSARRLTVNSVTEQRTRSKSSEYSLSQTPKTVSMPPPDMSERPVCPTCKTDESVIWKDESLYSCLSCFAKIDMKSFDPLMTSSVKYSSLK